MYNVCPQVCNSSTLFLFSVVSSAHTTHMPGCGGIYCEKCTHNNVELPGIEERVRACHGCYQGETPGDRVRMIAKTMEDSVTEETFAVAEVRLHHGTLYGETIDAFQKSDGGRAHPAGYFELTNKSEEIIAVRVCEGTVNPFYECSRPSYLAGEVRRSGQVRSGQVRPGE